VIDFGSFPRQAISLLLSSTPIDFDNTENILLKDIIYIYRNITESQIDELFSKYGNIVQKNILRDKLTGLPRGVAFVRWVNN